MERTRIFVAGGGTGGHLYPGLAIARALVRLAPTVDPFFIGAQRGIERDVLPTTEFPHALLDLHPLYRRAPWNNWRTLVGGFTAWRALSRIARERTPRAIVGTGGYAAGAALAWGRAHGVPTMLFEADSHPGLTTRVFARGASALFLGFPEAASRLSPPSQSSVLAAGCPIEPPPVPRPDRAAARAQWGFPADARVVLVVGGSQGARAINEAVAAWCDAGLPDNTCVIWSTGKAQATAYLDREGPRIRVRPYLAPIADAYAAADIAIARAGAMSIAELCAWEVPMILVPLPTAAQDHQTRNAVATEAAGAALHMSQATLTAATLDATVRRLVGDVAALDALRAGARTRARPDAADQIARTILARIGIAPS